MPAFADDAAGLLRCAFRTRGVTVYLEPKFLYNHPWARSQFPRPELCVPVGRARAATRGHGSEHHHLRKHRCISLCTPPSGWQKEGIECEVLDLRTIVPYDREAIAATVRNTGKALVVHEAGRTGGFGGEDRGTHRR
jgi:2-oxoisovalerate dehydrogenase E1 component